jgi:copper chaperone NosL
MTASRWLAGAAAAGVLVACAASRPRPIAFGTEACSHCHMTIAEPRYAAVLLTTTGKTLAFDDPGCLLSYLANEGIAAEKVQGVWFHSFLEPDSVYPAARVRLVRSDTLRTPMASGLAVAREGPGVAQLEQLVGGRGRTWDELRAEASR